MAVSQHSTDGNLILLYIQCITSITSVISKELTHCSVTVSSVSVSSDHLYGEFEGINTDPIYFPLYLLLDLKEEVEECPELLTFQHHCC